MDGTYNELQGTWALISVPATLRTVMKCYESMGV